MALSKEQIETKKATKLERERTIPKAHRAETRVLVEGQTQLSIQPQHKNKSQIIPC